jgi:hypothetical protein
MNVLGIDTDVVPKLRPIPSHTYPFYTLVPHCLTIYSNIILLPTLRPAKWSVPVSMLSTKWRNEDFTKSLATRRTLNLLVTARNTGYISRMCHPCRLHMPNKALPLFAAISQLQYIPRNTVGYNY